MSTPKETSPPLVSIPVDSYSDVVQENLAELPAQTVPDPDNPPWGIPAALLTWVLSVGLLFVMGFVALIILVAVYALYKGGPMAGDQIVQFLKTDQLAILVQVLAVIPAHALTLGAAWWVVTDFGKRPFWRSLGWSWKSPVEVFACVGLAVGLLLLGGLLTRYWDGEPTEIDQIINSSASARFALAFLATATAPLVEEVIYRGILYPALQRAIGTALTVASVTILFLGVHIYQYQNNLSVIAAIGILSLALTLVRAYSGRLLPCFIIHLVFNGLQSLYIILAPYYTQPEPLPVPKPGLVQALASFVTG